MSTIVRRAVALCNGFVGVARTVGAVALTLDSLGLCLWRYRRQVARREHALEGPVRQLRPSNPWHEAETGTVHKESHDSAGPAGPASLHTGSTLATASNGA